MEQRTPFLHSVAKRLLEEWSLPELRDSTVLLPSSRAFLHLAHEFHQLHPKGIVLPKRPSIGMIMEEVSQLHTVEPLQLLPTLHSIYQQHTGSTESLEEFFFWGNTLIHDFDQIDKYRINPHQLLLNQLDIKELDAHYDYLTPEQKELLGRLFNLFNPEGSTSLTLSPEESPPLRQKYLALWNALPSIYDALQEYMQREGIGYEGHIFRTAAQLLTEDSTRITHCPSYSPRWAIAGFNALNPCERILFSTLKLEAETLFFWKIPHSLQEGESSLAGLFIQRNLRQFPNSLPRESFSDKRSPLPVRIVSVPYSIAQVEALNQELDRLLTHGANPNSIAIVLTDESLLLPILQSLPTHHGEPPLRYNVTMGYPLRDTVVYTLLEATLVLLNTYLTTGERLPKSALQEWLNHPLLRLLPSCLELKKRTIPTGESETISPKDLKAWPELQELLTTATEKRLVAGLIELLEWVHGTMAEMAESEPETLKQTYIPHILLLEFIATAHTTLTQLDKALNDAHINPSTTLLHMLLPQAFREMKADFIGDPLNAVQIMGFLETRTLDFEHIIIVSCNEKYLPGNTTPPPSFILPNLAYAFGLPTPRERTAMYSYYFESLLNTSQQVSLLHVDNSSLPGGQGEASRFLRKLHLFPRLYETIHLTLSIPLSSNPTTSALTPTPERIQRFTERYTSNPQREAERKLSPTALIAYYKCPHLFQLRYIAEIKPPDDPPSPELTPLEIGNIAHQCLQALYTPLVGLQVTPELLQRIPTDRVEEALLEAFRNVRSATTHSPCTEPTPTERINLEIAKRIVLNTLTIDSKRSPEQGYRLVALEKEIEATFTLQDGTRVPIRGFIDRLERTTPTDLTIIDYKTGRHDPTKYTLNTIEELMDPGKPARDYLFQILLYCAMAHHRDTENSLLRITPSLWLIESNPEEYTPRVMKDKQPLEDALPLLEEFTTRIIELLENIFRPGNSFSPYPRPRACDYCDYRALCPKGQSLL